ncbi:hypothetical protein QFC22_004285 [Naganishia vaughanmartiniae]|uniref:Uncharacterized protein n=1 Tax=Naganishia vaughanmartiniae TaxID=1424756 RepID=A0ACC2X237_9TREE|nr:hypothetical protein QFC22_004285 [Naganishia vaughanmartiniae]
MSTKHRILTSASRARVRSSAPSSVLAQARLAPRSGPAARPPIIGFTLRSYSAAIALQQHDEITQHAPTDDRRYTAVKENEEASRNVEEPGETPRFWASALTSPLDELADDEVIEVLKEALRENRSVEGKEDGPGLHNNSEFTSSKPTTRPRLLFRNALARFPTATAVAGLPSPTRSAVSLITLVLAIRTRPTYRHILSTIPPPLFGALLTHLIVDIGAIHLVHLLLHDISTRSFGRLDVVREALGACCRSYTATEGGNGGYGEAEGLAQAETTTATVDKRHVLNLLEMLDDSCFCPPSTSGSTTNDSSPAQHYLDHQTLRTLLRLGVDDSPSVPGSAPLLAIDAARLVHVASAFAQSIRLRSTRSTITEPEKEDDIWLLQQTLLSLVRVHEIKAGQAVHQILLNHQWIIDDPCLHRPANTDSSSVTNHTPTRRLTPLGVCVALINTLNQHQQPTRALQLIELATRENMVKPHSKLGPIFEMSVNTTCRIVVASRSPATLDRMGAVLPCVISSGKVDVSPRIVKAFHEVCDEDVEGKGRGTMKRFVRILWERVVDTKTKRSPLVSAGNSRSGRPEIHQFLPTGRPLAHLLEYMARKATPWQGSDAAMLRWLVQEITVHPAAFLQPATAGAVIVTLLSFDASAVPRRLVKRLYERIVDERDDVEREVMGYTTTPHVPARRADDHAARDRLRTGVITDSEAMLKLVQASVSRSVACKPMQSALDGKLDPAMLVVQRYIQYSPPLAQLSVDDLARLARAFFLLGSIEAGVRMVKYIIVHRPPLNDKMAKRKSGGVSAKSEDKAVRILRWALTNVPSSAGEPYLELLDLALAQDGTMGRPEVITGKHLFENLMQKGNKALEFCQSGKALDGHYWKDRLEALRREWETRYSYNVIRDPTEVVDAKAR